MAELIIAQNKAPVVRQKGCHSWLTDGQKAECRRLRGQEGLSIIEISKRTGAAKSTVFNLVKDVPPPPSGLALISRSEAGRLSWKVRQSIAASPRDLAPKELPDLMTFHRGKLAELYFEAECIRRGVEVCKPVVDSRYDYVVITGRSHRRVQVKWCDGRQGHDSGTICVGLSRPRGSRAFKKGLTRAATYDRSEIDLIAAYVPLLQDFIIFGPEIFHKKHIAVFRIDDPRNGQVKGIKFAKAYLWDDNSLS